MTTKETKGSIYAKLLAVQREIGAIPKDKTNPHFKNRYFDINTLLDVVKPILNKHGLVLLQPIMVSSIATIIVDAESSERVENIAQLPPTPDAQKMGSAITYLRRYSLQSLLALEAEDDDGQSASQNGSTKANTASKEPNYNYDHSEPPKRVTTPNGGEGDPCPSCKIGKLGLKDGKYGPFLGCDRYPECKTIIKMEEGI